MAIEQLAERGFHIVDLENQPLEEVDAAAEFLKQREDTDSNGHRNGSKGGPEGLEELPNSIRIYLLEIGDAPLLTAEQEVRLGRTVQAHNDSLVQAYINEFGPNSLKSTQIPDKFRLAFNKRAENAKLVKEANEAREKLIESNLRLVVSVAKKYTNRGLYLLDLIQEGNLGLMRAVERFDPEKGFRFSTYATHWIRQGITRGLADQSRLIRFPVHVHTWVTRINGVLAEFRESEGRVPTSEEILEKLNETQKKKLTLEMLDSIMLNMAPPVSIETPIGMEEDDGVLGDFIQDQRNENPEAKIIRRVNRDLALFILKRMRPRYRLALSLRYGVDLSEDRDIDEEPLYIGTRTLEETGQSLGISRERIRQMEARVGKAALADPRIQDLLPDIKEI